MNALAAAHGAVIAAALLALTLPSLRADTIVLRDGHEYEGVLERATAADIEFRRNGELQRYPRADVVHIRLQRQREWDGIPVAAQIPDPLLQECLAVPVRPGDFADAASYVLHEGIHVQLRTPREWTEQRRLLVRILNEHGEDRSVQALILRKDADRVQIRHAIAVLPDRTVLHLRDSAVQSEAPYAALPRYDTVSVRRFALPAGKPGTVLDVATEHERQNPLPQSWFHREFLLGGLDPVRHVQIEILAPADCPLRWQVLHDPEGAVHYECTPRDGATLHCWRRDNAPALLPESMMPPLADVLPRLVVSTRPGTWREVAQQFTRSLDALAERYPEPVPLPAATATAVELLLSVNRNISEHPVDLLASGPLPADPAQTWQLRSGAPLDRVYLLYRWLRAAGRNDVEWVWIRPRDMGEPAADVPSLDAFTIPALRVPDADPELLLPGDELDRAEETAAAVGGLACLSTQGLQTLAPAAAAEFGRDLTVNVTLDTAGNATVAETAVFRGSAARALRAWRHNTEEEIRDRIENQVRDLDTRAKNIRYQVDAVDVNSPRQALHLQYEIPSLADTRPSLMSLDPPWLNFDAQSVGRDDRRHPLFWVRPRRDTVTVTIQSPPGMPLYSMPKPVVCEAPPASLTIAVSQTDRNARLELVYERTTTAAPAAAYAAFQNCLRTRAANGREYWVWRRPAP